VSNEHPWVPRAKPAFKVCVNSVVVNHLIKEFLFLFFLFYLTDDLDKINWTNRCTMLVTNDLNDFNLI
jgi:hypothetical protein